VRVSLSVFLFRHPPGPRKGCSDLAPRSLGASPPPLLRRVAAAAAQLADRVRESLSPPSPAAAHGGDAGLTDVPPAAGAASDKTFTPRLWSWRLGIQYQLPMCGVRSSMHKCNTRHDLFCSLRAA